jgi:hypothetical protein
MGNGQRGLFPVRSNPLGFVNLHFHFHSPGYLNSSIRAFCLHFNHAAPKGNGQSLEFVFHVELVSTPIEPAGITGQKISEGEAGPNSPSQVSPQSPSTSAQSIRGNRRRINAGPARGRNPGQKRAAVVPALPSSAHGLELRKLKAQRPSSLTPRPAKGPSCPNQLVARILILRCGLNENLNPERR